MSSSVAPNASAVGSKVEGSEWNMPKRVLKSHYFNCRNVPKFSLKYTCNSDNQYLSSSSPKGTQPEYHFSIWRSSKSIVSSSSFSIFLSDMTVSPLLLMSGDGLAAFLVDDAVRLGDDGEVDVEVDDNGVAGVAGVVASALTEEDAGVLALTGVDLVGDGAWRGVPLDIYERVRARSSGLPLDAAPERETGVLVTLVGTLEGVAAAGACGGALAEARGEVNKAPS
jgi:hypothetical protein